MTALRRLILLMMIVFCSVPLLAGAQNQEPDPMDDVPIPLPNGTQNPSDLVHPATPATEELIEYPTATLNVHPATPATEELIDYPSDPCAPSQAELEDGVVLPFPGCVTPASTPQPTTMPAELPAIVKGLWVIHPESSSFTTTGNCLKPLGVGQGDGGGGEVELPKVPACISPDNRWLTLDSESFEEIAPGVYSQTTHSREVIVDMSGTTTGTVNITMRTEYRIISPTEIEVVYIREEQDGCSSVSSVRYTLVEPNETVCVGVVITPAATLSPMPTTTLAPGETPQPIETPEPLIPTGTYHIGLPLPDATCTVESLPPSDTVNISYTDNQDMMIDFGVSSYTLFWDGGTSYQFMEKGLFQITVYANPGRPNFTWAKSANAMGAGCYVSSDLLSGDAPAAPAVQPTLAPTVQAGGASEGVYKTSAVLMEDMCPAAVSSTIPDLNMATLTAQAGDTFLFTLGDQSYTLSGMNGVYAYQNFTNDGSMLQISLNGFFQGQGSGILYLITSSGNQCMVQLAFNPA
jgi:hypothetical protein